MFPESPMFASVATSNNLGKPEARCLSPLFFACAIQ
jgi:hypothetical protein